MKKDKTFSKLYVRKFGAGSAYENLKIGKHDEYDIDLLFRIPEIAGGELIDGNKPGFVKFKLHNFDNLRNTHPDIYR